MEAQQLELFSIPLSNQTMEKEVEEATSFWLTPVSIQRLVTQYLQQKIGTEQEFILGEKPLKTLRLSQEARNTLLRDFQEFREKTRVYREWENWLKGTEQHLPITFEAACATQHPDAVFIMPIHPLVQASKTFRTDKKISPTLKVKSNKVPADRYEFAVYQWRYLGMKENLVLMSITSSDVLMPHLSSLLENAEDNDMLEEVNLTEKEAMEKTHHLLWSEAREKHRERIRAILEYRRENLSASHDKRIALLEEKIAQVPDPNIQRMRRQQIANAETDYNRRIQELEEGIEKADITAELVAYGVLDVLKSN